VELPGIEPMLYQAIWVPNGPFAAFQSRPLPADSLSAIDGVKTVESPLFSHPAAGGLVAGLDGGDGCGRVGPTDALEVHCSRGEQVFDATLEVAGGHVGVQVCARA
jgi:hypothetical protein